MTRKLRAATLAALLALLLAACTTIVQAPPEPELGEPVVIDICNTTVCQPWRHWHPHPRHHKDDHHGER